jgi:hypothetical protein
MKKLIFLMFDFEMRIGSSRLRAVCLKNEKRWKLQLDIYSLFIVFLNVTDLCLKMES